MQRDGQVTDLLEGRRPPLSAQEDGGGRGGGGGGKAAGAEAWDSGARRPHRTQSSWEEQFGGRTSRWEDG